MKRLNLPMLWFLAAAMAFACNSAGLQVETSTEQGISLDITLFAEAGMDTARVSDTVFRDIVRCSGSVDVPPEARRWMSSPMGGILTQCNLMEGERVKRNALLFYVESNEIADLRFSYLDAETQHGLLLQQVERSRRLAQGDATSQRELQQAEASYAIAKARFETLQQKINLLGLVPEKHDNTPRLSFRAPFDAIVARRMAHNGQFVQADMPIMELIDDSRKIIRLELMGNQAIMVKPGQNVMLLDALGNPTGLEATLTFISPAADPATSAVSATAIMRNASPLNLPVGTFVQAGIVTGERAVKYLPAAAIIPREGKQYVLVVSQTIDNTITITPTEVLTGQTIGPLTEILSPLPTDRPVISKGGFQLLQ